MRIFLDGNRPPSIGLSQPVSGAEFTAPAVVPLVANASDSDGAVAWVEFFLNGNLLGSVTAPPFEWVARGLMEGVHRFRARAFDNLGATMESAEVIITVRPPNIPPVVSLVSSTGSTVPVAPAEITLLASATDADGIVQRVTFLRDGVSVGEDIQAPFSLTLSGLAPGTYQFSARATDDRGATTASSPVQVTVNQAPTVVLTQPAAGAVFDYPASVTLAAEAADADGQIGRAHV